MKPPPCRSLKTRMERMLLDSPLPVLLLNEQRLIVDLSARPSRSWTSPRRRRGLLETMGSHELDEAARRPWRRSNTGHRDRQALRRWPPYLPGATDPLPLGRGSGMPGISAGRSATMDFGELRSQFAATVSHELRTPLAGIRAMVEALQDPAISPEEASRFLGRVDQETQRLGQLVDEILFCVIAGIRRHGSYLRQKPTPLR